jgi:Polysaccharide lyase family 4, domain II
MRSTLKARIGAKKVASRRPRRKIAVATAFATMAALLTSLAAPTTAQAQSGSCGSGDPATVAGSCTVTIDALDFASNNPLANFTYIVNVDNTKLPSDPLGLSTESNSPIVREGDQGRPSVTLPDGRYLVSVRSLDHKMWGAFFTLPDDAASNSLTLHIALTEQSEAHPLPLGKIRVFVFEDNAWTNGAPDTEEGGLGGFQVGLEEQTGLPVTVDYNNHPLCGGICKTSSAAATRGFAEINNLGPATYNIDVHPPSGPCNSDPDSAWYQTTTIDGGLQLQAPTEEGADGTGAPGEQLWEPPNVRTAYWFGFVCAPQPFATAGSGEIVGQARNWVEWAPYTTGTFNDSVENPFVALSDASSDLTVFVGQGDADGNFDIQNVPEGDYNLAVWDEQLSYIMRFKPVHVEAGQTVNVNDPSDDPNGPDALGVSRWFGWVDGYVYKDRNNDGMFDAGDAPMANTDMDQRWRDGSIKESTFTDPSGYYQYPTAEGGALGRWFVNEQGFARFSAYPGAAYHDEHTGAVIPSCVAGAPANPCIPNSQGGGLLVNQLVLEGHRATVDWGKRDYPAGTPGQIVGITYFATTRNEFNARNQAHEDYEPAIPDVTVYLEAPGPDGVPNTDDDVIVNSYVTDHWQQPNADQDPQDNGQGGPNSFTQNCNPIRDFAGANITNQFNPDLGPNCLEVPLTGQQMKEGAFDGGYAFADYCPPALDGSSNWNLVGDSCAVPMADLVAGDYIVHAIMPKDPTDTRDCNPAGASQRVTDPVGSIPGGGLGCLYHIVREEDVNVDLGNQFAPQIPPPPCNGDDHVIDQSTLVQRSNYYNVPGAHAPLCDKHLVVLQNGQNANADFFMMTNFPTDPNGDGTTAATGDVAEPGRVIGQVFNDIYFDRNQMSNWYGEPRPIPNIPIGIYARVDTVPNVNQPFSPDNWRLIKTITTSADGAYEILLPSTETFNCPIPQGPCPGMYIAVVDDPGSKAHPNANYNPNLLTANTPFEVWPGLTTQLDTPVDPISGTACEDPAGGTTPDPSDPARPDLLQVDRPYVLAGDTDTSRRITILSDFIGTAGAADATGGRVTLTDVRTGIVTTLTRANGGVVSWTPGSGSTPDTIVIQVPAVEVGFTPGPKQLSIITANANGGVTSVNGITIHVLSSATSASRTDNANTFNGTVVIDPSIVAADVGRAVSGTGIPAGTTIASAVSAGTTANRRFTLSQPATQTSFGPVTITKVDSGVSWTNSANNTIDHRINDPLVVAGDVGRSVTFTGAGIPNQPRTITSVVPGVSFQISGGGVTSSASGRTATITKTDNNALVNDGTFVIDAATSASDAGAAVSGAGIPGGATIVGSASFGSLSGFILSAKATATSFPATVPLTITVSFPAYNPTVVNVPPPPPTGAGNLQSAIDAAAPGSLIVLSPGTYNENVLVWKPLKIQGLGPGGIIGAHELQGRDPEDPRFNIKGSIIDGRFFQQNFTAFDNTVTAHAPYELPPFTSGNPSTVLRGADLTVVAKGTSAFDVASVNGDSAAFGGARIDGLGLMTGHGDGAGGVQLQASINNMQITNNVLENNGGVFAGGIGVGQPFVHGSHNYNVRISHDRLIGNGGLTTSGGAGIFYGSNNYELANSVVCSNFSVEYGAGISHIGLSPGGSIKDNRIYYNEAVDSGGGIAIEGELVVGAGSLSAGSGAVNVDRNLIQSNMSTLDDGGGIFVLDALDQPINIRNNMLVNNVAADLGGAIMLDDSSKVAVINNTIANNDTTGSSESSQVGVPHGAGLTAEANDPLWQGDARYTAQYPNPVTRPDFSNPLALFNNIFWNNDAMTLDQFSPGATLVDNGFIDFEIHGTTNNADTFTPRYSDLTNGQILGPNGVLHAVPGGQGNTSGDPGFVTPFVNELAVSGSRLDPQQAAVTITGQDPPVGLTGDYHLTLPGTAAARTASVVIDRGAGFSNLAFPAPNTQTPTAGSLLAPCGGTAAQLTGGTFAPADYDRQFRPYLWVTAPARQRTPWDLGADELLSSTPLGIPRLAGVGQFNWNGAGQLQCSSSTVPRTP